MVAARAKLDELKKSLAAHDYIAEDSIAMTLYLSQLLNKPILLEGPAGVGKTEIAKVLAQINEATLIRLQCYEGIDVNQAIYEWNYQKQLLYLKMSEGDDQSLKAKSDNIYNKEYLLARPLLQAIQKEEKTVLLIDEMDRSDEEFESFLLELLSDWQVSIPELGTIKATTIPQVIITSNRSRELSDALRRRCLYLWIGYPDLKKELRIVKSKLPDINEQLTVQIGNFMQEIRKQRLEKIPGIAETIEWATALSAMHIDHLDKEIVESTLGVILKDWKDVRDTQISLSELLTKVGVTAKFE